MNKRILKIERLKIERNIYVAYNLFIYYQKSRPWNLLFIYKDLVDVLEK